KNCFDKFYLSHEINLRKPDSYIYKFVLNDNNVEAEECLFIDDVKNNITAAKNMNINTWHLNPEKDDVANLFKTQSALF
ncbi:HAD-IA family hydrolase, partial [Seonamhaeicola marinus]